MLDALPAVVTRSLVKYLELESKLSLRLTCTTTNKWVTDKNFLRKLKVALKSEEDYVSWISRYEETMEEDENFPGWTNFFLVNMPDNLTTLKLFFSKFSQQIEKLEINKCSANSQFFQDIIFSLPGLNCLTITNLDLTKFDTEKFGKPLKMHLKKLCIDEVTFQDASELRKLDTIYESLGFEAEYMTMPKPVFCGPPQRVMWSEVKALQLILVAQSILKMIAQSNVPKLVLDVKNLYSVNFSRLVEQIFSTDILLKKKNIYFDNVNDKHVKYVFLMSGDDRDDDFLQRILSLREKIDDRRPLYQWKNLEELNIRSSRCDIRSYYEDHDQNAANNGCIFPKLRKLKMIFDPCSKDEPGFLALHRVIHLLLNIKHPFVKELTLVWPSHGHNTPVDVVDVKQVLENFSGLEKFVIIENGISKRIL